MAEGNEPPAHAKPIAGEALHILDNPAIKHLVRTYATSEYIRDQLKHLPIISMETLLHDLLLEPITEYDVVEVCTLKSDENKVVLSAADYRFLLYSYIINRASAAAICDAEDYILRGHLKSATDEAFVWLLLAQNKEGAFETREDHDGKTYKAMVLPYSRRALEILRGAEPMRFIVQSRTTTGRPGFHMGPLENALFTFTEKPGGAWHTKWEYVSRSYGVCFHGDERYDPSGEWKAWRKSIETPEKQDDAHEKGEGGLEG